MTTTQPALLAFHSQQAIKDQYLARMEAHRAVGELVPKYARKQPAGSAQQEGSKWRGYAIYCLVHENTDPYGAAETQLGIPRVLARLLDTYFHQMSAERQATWPDQFLRAIAVGADLSRVWPQLAGWLLVAEPGVLRFAQTERQREFIQAVADLYAKEANGEEVPRKVWLAAEKAAHNIVNPAYGDATAALVVAWDASSDCSKATTYDKVYAAATTLLNADLDLAYAYGNAMAASNAVSTAYMLANLAAHAAKPKDTVCGAAAAAVSAATYAAALAETPVAVGAAAHDIARNSGYRSRRDAYPYFVADASIVYYDDLADKLLALLAAAPVPAGLANGQNSVS